MPTPTTTLPTLHPQIRLSGKVDDRMLGSFLDQLAPLRDGTDPIVVEVTTTGGDAEIGRRLALEVRLLRERGGRDVWFFGKSTVYSAGVTLMAAFPVERRVVSADVSLLVHERRLDKELKLSGPLRAEIAIVKDLLAQLEHGQALERDGFEDLVRGSRLDHDALMQRVLNANWYLRAPEALELGLVGEVV
jgi:ATP-dependent Clp protease protease subunit